MNTYFINAPELDLNIIKKRGNWKEWNGEDKVDLLIVDRYNYPEDVKIFYNKKIGIENIFDVKGFNKYELTREFLKNKNQKKYVQNQIALNPDKITKDVVNFIKPNKVYLVKPVATSGGFGIFAITDLKDLKNNYYKLKQNFKNPKQNKLIKQKKVHWVLQEYLLNPMLYKGHKFHFRVYYIIDSNGDEYVSKLILCLIAKNKYIQDDFNNKDIHDTHYLKETIVIMTDKKHVGFTKKKYTELFNKTLDICRMISPKLKYYCYDNIENCFNMFGCDFIFTSEGDCKLLEINKTAGTTKNGEYDYIYEGIMQEIVDKIYPPKIKTKKNNNLIKL
jgi:hypothetical protein